MLEQIPKPLAIYTDGSGINGKVGAVAVVPELNKTSLAYMGRESTSMVYTAELQGILMALQMTYTKIIQNPELRHRRVAIFTDN